MLTALTLPALNRVLRRNDAALQRLRVHAGKTARIVCAPFAAVVLVLESGELAAPRGPATPDVVIRLTPGVMLRLASGDERVWSDVGIEGDSDLATALNQVWRSLDWGVEEDLSRFVGDIAAHRIAGAARDARKAAMHAVDSAIANVGEYWTEEQPLLAVRRDVERYARDVDALRDAVARLEKRVEALQAAERTRLRAE
jgi:ubiquinone biosynthesis protein UbiJ